MAGLRADGVFGDLETRRMRNAYGLALSALELTHPITDEARHLLAGCLVQETMTLGKREIDVLSLAVMSIDRYLALFKSALERERATIH